MNSLTTDTFFNGRLKVRQDRSGYRYSIDAVLLANYITVKSGDTVVDLGTGCGIIPLILAYKTSDITIFGIDIQKELTEIAGMNVKENLMGNCIHIICHDIKSLKQKTVNGPADIVVSNPPYRTASSGRMNPNHQRAVARHEIAVTLNDVIETARSLLRTAGKFFIIYPAERLVDSLTQMRQANIEPKSLRMVHSYAHTEAKLALVEGIKNGNPGLKINSPLIIYKDKKIYTNEVEQMFSA